MRLDPFLPAPTLLLLLLLTACAGTDRSRHTEQLVGLAVAEPPPTSTLRRDDLVGRWRMQPKEENAIVPNIIFVLRPDGGLTFLRDDSGGTNFSAQFRGSWVASSPAPDRVAIMFDFAEAQPKRICYPLPGGCKDYDVPFREEWTFARTGPDMMETPGAVWRRDLTPAVGVAGSNPAGAKLPAGATGSPWPTRNGTGPAPAPPARSFAIHLASVRTPAEVPAKWRHLTERYPDLAELRPRASQAVDVPGKGTFYRVLGGVFATKAEAQAVCDRVRAKGQDCAVVTP
jgi:hypothetical protein